MSIQYGGDKITFADSSVLGSAWTGFKNRIINGAMMIDQRNAGASVTITNTSNVTYTLDRWFAYGTAASKFSVQQNAGSVTPPAGFINYFGTTSLSSYSVTSSDSFSLGQSIEGLNVADLGWGTANAQAVTLSFWVRSSLTGTFGGAIRNSAVDRSYPFTYTISSANTWELKSVTIAGDTSGTWLTTNGVGVRVGFGLGQGATFSGTAGAWASSNLNNATGATSVVGTSGATWYITGVQLEKGSTATSFDYLPYGTQLALCQRYYAKMSSSASALFTALGSGFYGNTVTSNIFVKYPNTMRSSPTTTVSTLALNDFFTNNAVTGVTGGYLGIDSAFINMSVASGGTANRPVILLTNNSASGYIDFSAEL